MRGGKSVKQDVFNVFSERDRYRYPSEGGHYERSDSETLVEFLAKPNKKVQQWLIGKGFQMRESSEGSYCFSSSNTSEFLSHFPDDMKAEASESRNSSSLTRARKILVEQLLMKFYPECRGGEMNPDSTDTTYEGRTLHLLSQDGEQEEKPFQGDMRASVERDYYERTIEKSEPKEIQISFAEPMKKIENDLKKCGFHKVKTPSKHWHSQWTIAHSFGNAIMVDGIESKFDLCDGIESNYSYRNL